MKPYKLLLLLPAFFSTTLVSADNSSYNDPMKFQKTMLDVHNRYRAEHQVASLKWDKYTAANARKYAENCKYKHSDTNYGENIAAGFEESSAAVEAWGDERTFYSFDDGGYSEGTGHFTQMVWKDTWSLGCGAALCDGILGGGEQWFLVCRYWAPGNVRGEYSQNVFPKKENQNAEESLNGNQGDGTSNGDSGKGGNGDGVNGEDGKDWVMKKVSKNGNEDSKKEDGEGSGKGDNGGSGKGDDESSGKGDNEVSGKGDGEGIGEADGEDSGKGDGEGGGKGDNGGSGKGDGEGEGEGEGDGKGDNGGSGKGDNEASGSNDNESGKWTKKGTKKVEEGNGGGKNLGKDLIEKGHGIWGE